METRVRSSGFGRYVVGAALLGVMAVAGAAPQDPDHGVNSGIIQALNSITGWRMNVTWGWQQPPEPDLPGLVAVTAAPSQGFVTRVDFVPPIDPEVPPVDPERPMARVDLHPPDPGMPTAAVPMTIDLYDPVVPPVDPEVPPVDPERVATIAYPSAPASATERARITITVYDAEAVDVVCDAPR